jgi:fatty-acyl-CoA synthase
VSTVAGLLAARADDPHPGLLLHNASWTWGEVVTESARRGALAESLRRPGPFHIGVLLPNVAEYLFWLGGSALAGAVVVGINPTRRGAALDADIGAVDCQLLVTDVDGAVLLREAGVELAVERMLIVGTALYEQQLASVPGARAGELVAAAPSRSGEELLLLLFTSGTTGTPKAVRCTQGRLAAIGEVAAPAYGYRRSDVCYCPMPLFHGNALMALWAPALTVGATVALRARFSASAFLDDVRIFGATMSSYVGKAIAYILATPRRPDDADNPLERAFGTEASAHDRARFEERFGCRLIEGYGSSEGGMAINAFPGMPPGALGKAPPGTDAAVVDPASGDECEAAMFGEHGQLLNPEAAIGEIVNRSGPGRFEGYYENADAEADRLRGGWYWTGDLGYRDAEGIFYFAGRSGDWLRVDSENMAAGPIEAVLARYEYASVVAVYAVPDTHAGDQVMAAFELVDGGRLDPVDFAAWLVAQPDLGAKWVPRYVRVTAVIPATATGKVTKSALRAEGWTCADTVFWRREPRGAYVLLTDEDRRHLAYELAVHTTAPSR